jgi:hypothetical protein
LNRQEPLTLKDSNTISSAGHFPKFKTGEARAFLTKDTRIQKPTPKVICTGISTFSTARIKTPSRVTSRTPLAGGPSKERCKSTLELPEKAYNKKLYFRVLWVRVLKLEVVYSPGGYFHPRTWSEIF